MKTNANQVTIIPTKGIAVDCGSVNGKNPGVFEYRIVDIETKNVIKNVVIAGTSSNNIAEFLAIAEGINYCVVNHIDLPVYSDSLTALAWYRDKKCKTKLNVINDYQLQYIKDAETLFRLKHGISVKFWNKKLYGSEIAADYGNKTKKRNK